MRSRDILPGLPPKSAERLRDGLDAMNDPDNIGACWPMTVVQDPGGKLQFGLDMTYEDWRLWQDMPQITADTDNLDIFQFNWLLIDLDASHNLTGMQRGARGVKVLMTNTSAFTLTIKHLGTSSDTQNRFACAGSVDYSLAPGMTVLTQHDENYWWIGEIPGGGSPVFPGNVLVEGAVASGLSSAEVSRILGNLTGPQIGNLANLTSCQLQVLLTLTTPQIQSVTTNLQQVQMGNLLYDISSANLTSIVTGLTTGQLQAITNNFRSTILNGPTAPTAAQMVSIGTTLTNTEQATLTAVLGPTALAPLISTLTAVQIQTLVNTATSAQLVAISTLTPAQLLAITVNLTSITNQTAANLLNLARLTAQNISTLLSRLTSSQLTSYLNTSTASDDAPISFNGQTATSISTTQNNVSMTGRTYLPLNPTVDLTAVTGLVPTSPQLPQRSAIHNTHATNRLVLKNNSGSSTYPFRLLNGLDYTMPPRSSIPMDFDPGTAVWLCDPPFDNPYTATGDLAYSTDSTGRPTKLAVGSSGDVLTITGGVPTWAAPSSGSGGLIKATVFTSGGTWTPDAATAIAVVEVLGGGGGGGGATNGAIATNCGGGGGAGGYGKSFIPAATFGASQTVTVGAGGAGNSAAAGSNGGNSSFGSLVTGNGGGGGSYGTGATPFSSGGGGGAATGDIAFQGEAGEPGIAISIPACIGGSGGSTQYGSGGQGTSSVSADAGHGYGAGGGGAAASIAAGPYAGGTGGNGVVVVEEYTS